MSVSLSLPWQTSVADEDFRDLLRACLILTVLLSVLVPF